MKTWKMYAAGLAALSSWTPAVWAQIPAAPAAPAAVAAAGVAPAPGGLWTFLGLSKPQLIACKEKICATQFGKLMSNSMAPMRTFSGGIFPDCCAVPTCADLAKPADSAEGAAARIKADEAGAKARRAATRFLGTVDCHYWPEAEAGLIGTLRTDKNECVRMEAAWALGSGCCCTRKTVEALSITVSASDRDGNPAERSDRVREAARYALERCVACFTARCAMQEETLPPPKEQGPKEGAPTTEKPKKPAGPYYETIMNEPEKDVYERAREILDRANPGNGGGGTPVEVMPPITDIKDRSIFGVMTAAFSGNDSSSTRPADGLAKTGTKPVQAKPENGLAMAAHKDPNIVPVNPPVRSAKSEQPRGLLEVVRNTRSTPAAQPASPEARPERMPGAMVSVARPVARLAQPLPEPSTGYRTLTFHKPAQTDVQPVQHQLPAGTFLPQLLGTLKSGTKMEREWAANSLAPSMAGPIPKPSRP